MWTLVLLGSSSFHTQATSGSLFLKFKSFQNSSRDREIRHENYVKASHTPQHVHEEFLRFVQKCVTAFRTYLARMAGRDSVCGFAPRAEAFVSPGNLRDLFPHIQGAYDCHHPGVNRERATTDIS